MSWWLRPLSIQSFRPIVPHPCLDRGPVNIGTIGKIIRTPNGNLTLILKLLLRFLLRLLLISQPTGKRLMCTVVRMVCMGTHCLRPFNPRLGLENGASMVWILCKYRCWHCAGTNPSSSPCELLVRFQVIIWSWNQKDGSSSLNPTSGQTRPTVISKAETTFEDCRNCSQWTFSSAECLATLI